MKRRVNIFFWSNRLLAGHEELEVTEEELRPAALNDEKIRAFIEGHEVGTQSEPASYQWLDAKLGLC